MSKEFKHLTYDSYPNDDQSVYHYYGFYQIASGAMVHLDGVVFTNLPPHTLGRLSDIKKLIDPENAHRLTLSALTLLRGPISRPLKKLHNAKAHRRS